MPQFIDVPVAFGVYEGLLTVGANETVSGFVGIAVGPSTPDDGPMEPFIELDGIGNGNCPILVFSHADGANLRNRTAVANGEFLFQQFILGFDGTTTANGFTPGYKQAARLDVTAAENFSAGHGATTVTFSTVDLTTETFAARWNIDQRGNFVVTNGYLTVGYSSTFAALRANPPTGAIARITDSTVNTFGAVVAGGGANNVLAWFTGAAWHVFGA